MLGDKRLPSRSGSEHPLAATVARDFYVVCCCRRGYWGGPVSGVSTSRTCSACPRGSVIRTAGTPSRRARHGDARWCENLVLAGRRFRCRVLPLSVGEGVEVPHRFPALIAAPPSAEGRLWLTNARLFDGTGRGVRAGAAGLVQDGVIRRVSSAAEPCPGGA